MMREEGWWTGRDLNPGPPPRKSSLCAPQHSKAIWLGPAEEVLHQFTLICRAQYDNSPRTIYDQTRALKTLLEALRVPRFITRQDIIEALARLSKSARAHATKAIRKLLRALGHEDLVRGIKVPAFGARRWALPSDEELRRFYEALDREDARLALRLLAETGLRKGEVLTARVGDIDWGHLALIPNKASETKKSGIGFFTRETAQMLKAHIERLPDKSPEAPIFPYRTDTWLRKAFKRAEEHTGVHVCPQMLRVRFADKMGEVDVPDRYVDIMQGRSPQTVLARHYTPAALKRLRAKWERAAPLLRIC